jgi:hypothetical protein
VADGIAMDSQQLGHVPAELGEGFDTADPLEAKGLLTELS